MGVSNFWLTSGRLNFCITASSVFDDSSNGSGDSNIDNNDGNVDFCIVVLERMSTSHLTERIFEKSSCIMIQRLSNRTARLPTKPIRIDKSDLA